MAHSRGVDANHPPVAGVAAGVGVPVRRPTSRAHGRGGEHRGGRASRRAAAAGGRAAAGRTVRAMRCASRTRCVLDVTIAKHDEGRSGRTGPTGGDDPWPTPLPPLFTLHGTAVGADSRDERARARRPASRRAAASGSACIPARACRSPRPTARRARSGNTSQRGVRLMVGAGWMIVSLMFAVLAAAVALRPTGWPQTLPAALALSTLLRVLGRPEARIGLVSTVLMRARFLVILGTRAYEHTNPPVNRTIGNRTGVPQRYARNIGPSYWLDRSMARGAPAAEHRISGGTFGAVGWKLTL